jgi:RNA polymerase sigma-70 factor (ECF subfamily)
MSARRHYPATAFRAPPMSLPVVSTVLTDRTEQFLTLFNRHQRQIYGFVRSMLARLEDAEEVFQETSVAMWRSFDQFQEGTNALAWARQIAKNRVLAFCKKRRRDPLMLSPEAIEALAQAGEEDKAGVARSAALANCMRRLAPSDREIIAARYGSKATTVQVAKDLGRPLNTIYKALQRIRRSLLLCVERTLAREELA